MRADEFETPLIEIQGIDFGAGNRVFAKCENPYICMSHISPIYLNTNPKYRILFTKQ